MKTTMTYRSTALVEVALSGSFLTVDGIYALGAQLEEKSKRGVCCAVLNFSGVKFSRASGMAACLELVARLRRVELIFCALPNSGLKWLKTAGLDRGLTIVPSLAAAIALPFVRRLQLSGVQTAVIWSPAKNSGSPLSQFPPMPLSPVCGRSILARCLDSLAEVGLADFLINSPAHQAEFRQEAYKSAAAGGILRFLNEVCQRCGDWRGENPGSAAVLKAAQDQQSLFLEPFLVVYGTALIDLNVAEIFKSHKESGALVTVARGEGGFEKVTGAKAVRQQKVENSKVTEIEAVKLLSLGRGDEVRAYVLSPDALGLCEARQDWDIENDLLPAVLKVGGKVNVYCSDLTGCDAGDVKGYASMVLQSLSGEAPFVEPVGDRVGNRIWARPGATLSKRAKVDGALYLDSGACIEKGAVLQGACSLGKGAVVEEGAILRNCLVMPGATVEKGAWASGMIIHPEGAINHELPQSIAQDYANLDGFSKVETSPHQRRERA